MVAAGFFAGRVVALRCAMAVLRSKRDLAQFEDDLPSGVLARGYDADFANGNIGKLMDFAARGFPEPHVHSFALIASMSCWFK